MHSFNNIADVKECRILPGRVAFLSDAAPEEFWNRLINVPGSCVRNNENSSGVPVLTLEDGLALLRNNTVDYFFSLEGSVASTINRHCDEFVAAGESFFQTSVAFVLPKKSSYLEIFNSETRRLREQDAFTTVQSLIEETKCPVSRQAAVSFQKSWLFFLLAFVAFSLILALKAMADFTKRNDQSSVGEVTSEQIAAMNMAKNGSHRPEELEDAYMIAVLVLQFLRDSRKREDRATETSPL